MFFVQYLISASNHEFAQNNRAIWKTGATGSCFAGMIYKSILLWRKLQVFMDWIQDIRHIYYTRYIYSIYLYVHV